MAAGKFDTDQAAFLARAAVQKHTVTYGEFVKGFGYANQGCGEVLTQMGERLRHRDLPLLPVLVVNQKTKLPSSDASFYDRLGIGDEDAMRKEQDACFDYDLTKAPFWKGLA